MADIIFTREYQDVNKLIDYKIIIDGSEKNIIRNGTKKVVSLKEGKHKIYIKCMNSKSKVKEVNLKKGDTLRLSCGSNLTGLKVAFSWLFMFGKNNIYLKETKILE